VEDVEVLGIGAPDQLVGSPAHPRQPGVGVVDMGLLALQLDVHGDSSGRGGVPGARTVTVHGRLRARSGAVDGSQPGVQPSRAGADGGITAASRNVLLFD